MFEAVELGLDESLVTFGGGGGGLDGLLVVVGGDGDWEGLVDDDTTAISLQLICDLV